MKRKAFILANSNLFTVFSKSSLKQFYDCELLNLRYSNEEFSSEEHLIQQIQDLFYDEFYNRGLFTLKKSNITFTDRLTYRIDSIIKQGLPSIIFYEMKNLNDDEWTLLKHIHDTYNIPIAAFIPVEENNDKTVYELLKYGVKEVFSRLDDDVFSNIAKRNIKT